VLALLFLVISPAVTQAVEAPSMVLTDLWDGPHLLKDICGGRPTILYVCDTEASVCREGAVFFDARAKDIMAHGVQAILIFIGSPAGVRDLVITTGIIQPVYVDSGRRLFGGLLDEEILPALVLVDGDGRRIRTMYGGGESLDGNISMLLEERRHEGHRWWLIALPVVAAAAAVVIFIVN
jgi:hypothetical protein